MKFYLRAASQLYIDGEVEEEDGSVWQLTGFYGEPKTDMKESSWSVMRVLNAASALVRRPWLCLGDSNEILFSHEKEGGLPKLIFACTDLGSRWRCEGFFTWALLGICSLGGTTAILASLHL